MNGKTEAATGAVKALRPDTDLASAIDNAIGQLDAWGTDTLHAGGFLAEIFNHIAGILRVIRFGRTNDQINEAVFALVQTLTLLDEVFSDEPFGNPSIEKLRSLSDELKKAKKDWDPEKLTKLSKQTALQEAELSRLNEELDNLRRLDKGRIDRLTQTMSGVGKKVQLGLEGATERLRLEEVIKSLREKIARLEAEKRNALKNDIDHAGQLVETLQAAARELQSPAPAVKKIDETTTDQISAEIERRLSWLRSISDEQERAESERDSIRERIEGLSELIRLGADEDKPQARAEAHSLQQRLEVLGIHIAILIDTSSRIREKINSLRRYGEALQCIAIGLPPELFAEGQPKIPSMPERAPIETVTAVVDKPDPQGKAPEVRPTSDRRLRLQSIAESEHLTAASVLIISLYEAAVSKKYNPMFRKVVQYGKSVLNMIIRAWNIGILQKFDWSMPKNMFTSWHGTDDETSCDAYLKYCGNVKGNPVYRRTEKPLPWKFEDILTDEEIYAFIDELNKKTESV